MGAEQEFTGQRPKARRRLNEMYMDIQRLKKRRGGAQIETFLFCKNGVATYFEIEARQVPTPP